MSTGFLQSADIRWLALQVFARQPSKAPISSPVTAGARKNTCGGTVMVIGTNSQFRRSSIRALWTLVLTASLALRTSSSFAVDLSKPVPFDIPAQPLSSALVQFADQAGVQFTAPGASLDGLRSGGIHGRYSPTEALARLLRRTGLGYRIVDRGTVAITRPGAPAGVSGSRGPDSRAGKEGKTGSSARFRVGQMDQGPTRSADSLESAAGEPHTPRAASNSRYPGLREVVVTATRRAENILSVPVAVSALSGAELSTRHVETAVDLANYVPSLSVSSGVDRDDYIFAIRGMGPTGGSCWRGRKTAGFRWRGAD